MNTKFLYYTMIMFFYMAVMECSFVIDDPGLVKWRVNVATELQAGLPIIHITSSHVVLDLEGFCLTQDSLNTATGIIGIEIAANVEDVIVKNGTILSINGIGVKVNDGVRGVKIENLTIDHCAHAGILLDGKQSGTGIEDVVIKECNVLSCTGINGQQAVGVSVSYTNKFEITACNCLKNDAQLTANGYGIFVDHGEFGKINSCAFIDNGGNEQAAGCYLVSCTNIIVKDCSSMHTISRSSSSDSIAVGFYSQHSDSIIMYNCESLENVSTNRTACGFKFENGNGNIVRECVAENNTGATAAAGFQLASQTRASIELSIAKLNHTTSSGTGYGIHLSGSLNDRCYIHSNNIEGNIGIGASRGIVDDRNPSTSVFTKNRAFDNGTNYSVSYPTLITLPRIIASLSNTLIGLPDLLAGELDNIDITP